MDQTAAESLAADRRLRKYEMGGLNVRALTLEGSAS